jgi:GH24 family phage-related lysozyme (muramidase)
MEAPMCRPKWFEQVRMDLRRHEGFRLYAYPDPLSHLAQEHRHEPWGEVPAREILNRIGADEKTGLPWTVGYGFTKGVTPDTEMSQEEANIRLDKEIQSRVAGLTDLVSSWEYMPVFASSTLMNLDYNMGIKTLAQFGPTLDLIRRHEYAEAGRRLTHSKWYTQVGDRGKELVARLTNERIEPEHDVTRIQ